MANPVPGSEEWFQAIADGLTNGESGGPITDTQIAAYISGLDTLSNAAVKLIASGYADAAKAGAISEALATITDVRSALVQALTTGDADTLAAAKRYTDEHAGNGGVTELQLDEAVAEGVTTANAYTDDQADGILAAAKAYADSADLILASALQAYADNVGSDTIAAARTYTDNSAETLADGLTTSMDTKDEQVAADTLAAAIKYVTDHPGGGASSAYVDQGDSTTLSSAKTYADNGDATNLTAAKTYADTKKTEAQTYADNKDVTNLTAAKTYADTGDSPMVFGRLMPYAKEISTNADANNFLESGWYQAQNALNAPNADYFFYRTISRDATGSSTQEAIGINGLLKGRRLYRSKDGGVWGGWQLFDRQEMLDQISAATPDTGWIALAVIAGYETSSGLQYRRIGKRVQLRGNIQANSGNLGAVTGVATLPAGFRPAAISVFSVLGSATSWARLIVNANGTIDLGAPSAAVTNIRTEPVTFLND